MIVFKQLKYKNFLSSGNNEVSINFEDRNRSLIVGTNGAGKSSLIDALSFSLFGKPHRKITKGQMINSINNKGLLTHLTFTIGTVDYSIQRGLKPNIFKIFKDGVEIPVTSNIVDYQKYLEENILMMSQKTFEQIIVIGASSFVPFMQLPLTQRRQFIENLLDIGVFGIMNNLNRQKLSETKSNIAVIENTVRMTSSLLSTLDESLKDVNEALQKLKQDNTEECKKLLSQAESIAGRYEPNIESYLSEIKSKYDNGVKLNGKVIGHIIKLRGKMQQLKNKREELRDSVSFYKTHEDCETCCQNISEEFRKSKIKELNEEIESINSQLETFDTAIEKGKKAEERYKDQCLDLQKRIEACEKDMKECNEYMTKLKVAQDSREKDAQPLKDIKFKTFREREITYKNLVKYREEEVELKEKYEVQMLVRDLLKDDGIKTCVIQKYIPLINKKINEYLGDLDFFVAFELDEEFKETIKSRHRDVFSYDSFSEGEKQRIDISILFTWRAVAQHKNSVCSNLLILDETFDSSLDDDGINNIVKILRKFDKNSHIFVISHKRKQLEPEFERVLEFKKENNFTKVFTSYNR